MSGIQEASIAIENRPNSQSRVIDEDAEVNGSYSRPKSPPLHYQPNSHSDHHSSHSSEDIQQEENEERPRGQGKDVNTLLSIYKSKWLSIAYNV